MASGAETRKANWHKIASAMAPLEDPFLAAAKRGERLTLLRGTHDGLTASASDAALHAATAVASAGEGG